MGKCHNATLPECVKCVPVTLPEIGILRLEKGPQAGSISPVAGTSMQLGHLVTGLRQPARQPDRPQPALGEPGEGVKSLLRPT